MPFLLAFALGMVAGLRSMTAPAATCLAVYLGWFPLRQSWLMFLGAPLSVGAFSLFAVAELIADKLPSTPSRLSTGPLAARFFLGGFSGAALCTAAGYWGFTMLVGAVIGANGALAGAFLGYHARRWLTHTMGIPDLAIALIEDAIAIGGAFLIVSRGV